MKLADAAAPIAERRNTRSIRVRLTVLIVVSLTLLLATFAFFVRSFADMHFKEIDNAELDGKLAVARVVLQQIATPADLATAQRSLSNALVGHNGVAVRVFSDDDEPLLSVQNPPERKAGDRTAIRLRSEYLEHSVLGRVRVEATLDVQRHLEFMSELLGMLLACLSASVPVAGFVGWFVAGRALRPIQDLARLAKAVSVESLGRRIATESVPSELKDLALSFDAMLDRLQESFVRLADYSVDLAHELRTPLNNLITQSEVALSRPRDVDEYREVLYAALDQCRRLSRMINDMLFIARAEKGLLTPQRAVIDVAATAAKVLEYFQPLAADHDVTLVQRGTATMMGDGLMVERALANLVSNAVRHAAPGTQIELTVDAATEAVVISVTNRGDTIPADGIARLFERFYRADAGPRAGEGSGLGLAITKSIAEAHGGTVTVHSRDGTTRFELQFPREAPQAGVHAPGPIVRAHVGRPCGRRPDIAQ